MNKGGRKKEEKKIDLKDLKKKWYPQLKSGKRYTGGCPESSHHPEEKKKKKRNLLK